MNEKIKRAHNAMLRALMFLSPSDDKKATINDISNSIAENYEEYMKLYCYLVATFHNGVTE